MVKSTAYCPDRGDIIWLEFTPQAGREQAGRRPALVLSPKSYNHKTQLALVCPITSKIKDYPFEVIISQDIIHGAVLSDHVRNIDWLHRHAEFITTAMPNTVAKVVEKIQILLDS